MYTNRPTLIFSIRQLNRKNMEKPHSQQNNITFVAFVLCFRQHSNIPAVFHEKILISSKSSFYPGFSSPETWPMI